MILYIIFFAWRCTNTQRHPMCGHVKVHVFNLPITSELTFLYRVHAKMCYPIGQYMFCIWLDLTDE